MKDYEFNVRVRYAETDQMGVVYHGNYAQYFEMGRVEWLRNLGISYKWMEENGVMLPVVSLQMDYKKPARYDDLLRVKTILKSQTSVKIEFDYEIYNEQNDLLTTGYSMLVFVDMKTGRPIVPPSYVTEKISGIENCPNNKIEIYNRWGIKVYETNSYNTTGNIFEGYSQARTTMNSNETLPAGTYFYFIEVLNSNTGETNKLSGYILIN